MWFKKSKKEEDNFIKSLIDANIKSWKDFSNLDSISKSKIQSNVPSDIDLRLFVSTCEELNKYLVILENKEDYERCSKVLRVLNIKKN